MMKFVCIKCKTICTPNKNGNCPGCNGSLLNYKSKSQYRRLMAQLDVDIELAKKENS